MQKSRGGVLQKKLAGAPLSRDHTSDPISARKKFFSGGAARALGDYHTAIMFAAARAMHKSQAIVTEANFDRQRPADRNWLAASRLRAFATYMLVVELEDAHRALVARAIGTSKTAITKQIDYWTDRRDQLPDQTERIIQIVRAALT